LDDILNEYTSKLAASGTGSDREKARESLDEVLLDYDIKEGTPKPDAPDSSAPQQEAEPQTAEPTIEKEAVHTSPSKAPDDGGFEKKYGKLSGQLPAVPEVPEVSPDKQKGTHGERSFSEKIEQGTDYPEDNKERETLAERLANRKNAEKAKTAVKTADDEETKAAAPAESPKKDNPFDKYSAISEENAKEDIAPAAHSAETVKSLDDILAEYADTKNQSNPKREYTQHKSITGFFTRRLPSDRETGNTELLDGMMRMKRERVSRTQHISPVERKSITDIDLNLDDKIIPDTGQIPIDPEMDKLNELKERRSKKIKDFVLVGDEEDEPEEETKDENSQGEIEDFEVYEDAPSIAADILQLKNSLVMRMLVLVICLGVSLYIAVANDMGLLPVPDMLNKHTQTTVYLFVNAIIGILAAVSANTVISCGLSKLLSLKADCDSLAAAATVASIAECIIMFAGNTNLIKGDIVHIYIAPAICALVFNTAGKLLIVSRTARSFRFVSGSGDKYAILGVEDEEKAQNFTRGALRDFPRLVSMRKTEFLTEFLKTSYSSDSTDKFCKVFTPIILAAALIVGILAGITSSSEYTSSGLWAGISAFVGCISLCSAFSLMLVVNLPMAKASSANAELQGAVLGYDCIEEFADTNSLLVDACQLFPVGSVNLSAIKVFSDTRIDEVIVEAASLTSQAGSILKNMFYDIIAGKTELLNPVESYIFEDSMGLCGWINNKRILLGSRELMINHSIEGVPSAEKEKEYTSGGKSAMYLSISGELSAMFIIELTPSMEVKQALESLQKQEIYTVVRTVDSLVSINHLSELFEVSPEYFKLLPFRNQSDYEEVTEYKPKQKAFLACSGKFASFASLITSCRNMRGTISTGIAMEAVSVLLGILICIAIVLLKSFSELSATMVIAYNIVFAAILMAFQSFRKN
jgi:Cu+-exporting ATPase